MTTLALTPPPLRRLFQRVDAAPLPKSEAIARVLEIWLREREADIYPQPAMFGIDRSDPSGEAAFVWAKLAGERDYVLMRGSLALAPLLGPMQRGARLSRAGNPRLSVRLRRLFEFVRAAGEPILAEFSGADSQGHAVAAELLVAPLSSDGRVVDAFLGAAAFRRVAPASRGGGRMQERSAGKELVFALDRADYGREVAAHLGLRLAPHEERVFEDGELKIRPLADVAGRDILVMAGLDGDTALSANDKLCRLLFFVGALKDSGAGRVRVVAPYLCYARKDRRTKIRDPITLRYVAQLFGAMGVDRLVTLEVHNPAAFENAFRCPTVSLDAHDAFARHFAARLGAEKVTVVSPDIGGAKRAEALRERLEAELGRPVGKAIMDKTRSGGAVGGDLFAGDVAGCTAIVIDDLISAGTTMARAAAACRLRGAERVLLAATHGLFADGAKPLWQEPAIEAVVVTDTVAPRVLDPTLVRNRLTVLPTAAILARAMAAG